MTTQKKTEKKRKIAIVGTADSYKDAPVYDDSWEIWTFCAMWETIPRCDRFFEMHDQDHFFNTEIDEKLFEFIRKSGKDAYVADPIQFPDATPFPFKKLYDKFGRRYFTSTAAYVVALALLESPDQIGLWGVDMASDNEYATQRACCEYYLGMIVWAGIKLYIHPDSSLLKGSLYPSTDLWRVRQKIEPMTKRAKEAELKAHHESGKLDMLLLLEKEMR